MTDAPKEAWNAHVDDLTWCDDRECKRAHISGEGLDRLRRDAQPEPKAEARRWTLHRLRTPGTSGWNPPGVAWFLCRGSDCGPMIIHVEVVPAALLDRLEAENAALSEVVEAYGELDKFLTEDHSPRCGVDNPGCDCGLIAAAEKLRTALAALDARKERE